MKGLNKVMLIGRVGADPELRGDGDRRVASITLATSEQWKDNNGERQERTEWHRVSFFGKLAEIVESYVKKGSALYVEGKIRTRKYEQDGVTKYATEILSNEMQMLNSVAETASATGSSTRGSGNDAGGRRAANPPSNNRSNQRRPADDDYNDDIPF